MCRPGRLFNKPDYDFPGGSLLAGQLIGPSVSGQRQQLGSRENVGRDNDRQIRRLSVVTKLISSG